MRFATVVAVLAAVLASSAASAFTLEPIPGSTPQATRANAYFPNPIGVILRDDNGAPVANATVTFFPTYGAGEARVRIVSPMRASGEVTTDANGVALATGIVADVIPGTAQLVAYAPGVQINLPLTIAGGPATSVEYEPPVGQSQSVQVGHTFGVPWTVRALDADGLPVPYAIVSFDGAAQPGGASVKFSGLQIRNVAADATGVAHAPTATAGAQLGDGAGQACAYHGECRTFWFTVVDHPAPAGAELIASPFFTVEQGKSTDQPFVIRVLDAAGNSLAGVPVTFYTPCGSFAGAASVTVTSNAQGLASSPLFQGPTTAPSHCTFNIAIDGWFEEFGIDMFIFRAEDMTVQPYPGNFLETKVNEPFEFYVTYFAKDENGVDQPVDGRPVQVQVVGKPHGASADLVAIPPFVQDTTYSTLIQMKANKKHGAYMIAVTRGDLRQWFVVDQRKR